MTEKLFTRVSPQFDAANLDGVVVAAPNLTDTYGFTELGYDTADYGVAPTVLEVTPTATNYATTDDVEAAAARAGIKVWMDLDQYLAEWPGASAENFEEKMYPAIDGENPNQLLARPEIVAELEAAGFDAYRGFIVIGIDNPEVHAFWKSGTFSVGEPLALTADDAEDLHEVELDTATAPTP